MSCFIVSDYHISALVAWAVRQGVALAASPDAVAHELASANRRAYSGRYSGRYDSSLAPFGGLDRSAGAELLPVALDRGRPDICFYLAGADPYEDDRLGRLALTMDGLAARDAMVRDCLGLQGVPVVVLLAGGYGRRIEDTVAINLATVRAFARHSPAA